MIKSNNACNTNNVSLNFFAKVFSALLFLLGNLEDLSYANENVQDISSINLWAPALKDGDEDLVDLKEPTEATVTLLDVLHMNDGDRYDFNYQHNKLFQIPHSNEMQKIINYLSFSFEQKDIKAGLLRDFGGRLEACVKRAKQTTNPAILEVKRFYSQMCAECYLRAALMGNKSAIAVIQLDASSQNIKENYISVLPQVSLEQILVGTPIYKEFLDSVQKVVCDRHKWDQNWTNSVTKPTIN